MLLCRRPIAWCIRFLGHCNNQLALPTPLRHHSTSTPVLLPVTNHQETRRVHLRGVAAKRLVEACNTVRARVFLRRLKELVLAPSPSWKPQYSATEPSPPPLPRVVICGDRAVSVRVAMAGRGKAAKEAHRPVARIPDEGGQPKQPPRVQAKPLELRRATTSARIR